MDTFHKGIQYALEKLGKSKFSFERTAVSNFKSKRHEGFGNELVDYSRAPCLGADQKARGLWERDCCVSKISSDCGCQSKEISVGMEVRLLSVVARGFFSRRFATRLRRSILSPLTRKKNLWHPG